MERGCAWCGWTEPEPFQAKCNECGESLPDDDAVSHYHPGAVIMLEEKKEAN
jgi:ribosomal protein S26